MAKKKETQVINIDHLQTPLSETRGDLVKTFESEDRFIDITTLIEEFEDIMKDSDKWRKTVETISVTDENDVSGMKMARQARLAARETRIKLTKNIKKKIEEVEATIANERKIIADLKKIDNDYQNIWKPLEANLSEKEKTKERIEEQRAKEKVELGKQRIALLIPYNQDHTFSEEQLGNLPQEVFNKILVRVEEKYKSDIEELRKKQEEQHRLDLEAIKNTPPPVVTPAPVVEKFKAIGFEEIRQNPVMAVSAFESQAKVQTPPPPVHTPPVVPVVPVIPNPIPQDVLVVQLTDAEKLDKAIEMTRDVVRFMLQNPIKDIGYATAYDVLFHGLADAGKATVNKKQELKLK